MCGRARTALVKAIAATCTPDARSNGVARTPVHSATAATAAMVEAVDYADFRQRYVSMQQAMEMDIGNLRGRLRRAVAAKTPGLARLAVLDASMEQALSMHERTLLASVPTLLGRYFERLRATEQQRQADQADTLDERASSASSSTWVNAFRKDMQSVLLAELDVRFQPVEGLLAALRTR